MPHEMRRHVHAIYAYARIADDFADEQRSIARLDEWQHELELAYAGAPRHPVMVAVADTARRFDIPLDPFVDLLKAFRSDVEFQGFETTADLLGYARYSANPVGRLVLYLFGFRDAERQRLSDLICTGLQFANFWQDVAIDSARWSGVEHVSGAWLTARCPDVCRGRIGNSARDRACRLRRVPRAPQAYQAGLCQTWMARTGRAAATLKLKREPTRR